MKILVLSSWFPYPPHNGSRLRAWHLLEQLSAHHRLTLVSFAGPDDARPADLAALSRHCDEIHVVGSSPVHDRRDGIGGWFRAMPRSVAASYDPAMQSAVDERLGSHDVVIGLQQWTAPYLLAARSRPRVLDELEQSIVRDRSRAAKGPDALRHRMTWWKQARFARQVVSSLDRVTVVSEVEREIAVSAGCDRERIDVVANAVPASLLDHREQMPAADTLVYAGSVTYAPNLEAVRWFADTVLPLIVGRRPAASFTVTGSCAGVDLDGLAGRPAVCFAGYVDDIAELVAGTAVSVVPLREGGGTRLKILEALAVGTPVVSTSKGAEGLDVEDGRHLLIADTPEAFADRTLRALEDAGLRQRLRAEGRRLVAARYTWETSGRALEQTLERACEHWNRRHAASA